MSHKGLTLAGSDAMEIDDASNSGELPIAKNKLLGLDIVPVEVFAQICLPIAPLWLYQLSRTCQAMRRKLSSMEGNFIWYNAMPANMWQAPERFRNVTRPENPTMALWLPPLPPRPLNNFLGGPYRLDCDYKQEILNRFAYPTHIHNYVKCYFCLISCIRGSNKINRFWDMNVCSTCMAEYTITLDEIKNLRVPDMREALSVVEYKPYLVKYAHTYWRPEIDRIVCEKQGFDCATTASMRKDMKQQGEKERHANSRIEKLRRVARCKIVSYARIIWEGVDPMPISVRRYCEIQKAWYLDIRNRPNMPDPGTFRDYRERFAPTHKIHEFLFPDYKLSEMPTSLPYDPASGWLKDPTMSLTKAQQFSDNEDSFVFEALKMLLALADWSHPCYYSKNIWGVALGGLVTTWVNAATEHHVNRLERLLIEGVTVSISDIPAVFHHLARFTHVRLLRQQCGLQQYGTPFMYPMPKRPDPEAYPRDYSFEEYLSLDRIATLAENERAERMKYFNKVVRASGSRCPVSRVPFEPMGFNGLVKHMRQKHPYYFWIRNDWNAIY